MVASESVPLSVADLLSFAFVDLEDMNRGSILKLPVGALKSTISSNYTHIWEWKSQLASKSSERDAATVELESMERCPRVAKNARIVRQEQVQIQGPQLLEV